MKIYKFDLQANIPVEAEISGRYFLILSDGGIPFDLNLTGIDGKRNDLSGVQAGFGIDLFGDQKPQDKFLNPQMDKRFMLLSSVAQTVSIFIGNTHAEYSRIAGNVSINDGSKIGIYSELDANFLNFSRSGGMQFDQATSTLINPLLNVNGAMVQSLNVSTRVPAATPDASLIVCASPVAPTSANVAQYTIYNSTESLVQFNATDVVTNGGLKIPLKLPIGYGLYTYTNNPTQNTTAFCRVYGIYKFL